MVKKKFKTKKPVEEKQTPRTVKKMPKGVVRSDHWQNEETMRGLGVVQVDKEWRINRSDKLNWTIERWCPERPSEKEEGKTVAEGWKRQRGFYTDFATAAVALLNLIGVNKVDNKAVVDLREVITLLHEAEKKILQSMKKVLTSKR